MTPLTGWLVGKDAMVSRSPRATRLEESSEWAQSDARAEQICFVKEVLGLAVGGLSEEQASVFWPILAGGPLEECGLRHGIPRHTAATRLHRARSFMRRACAA
jgi:DNA-directed RNA polymerase specialized sigma24 family protein